MPTLTTTSKNCIADDDKTTEAAAAPTAPVTTVTDMSLVSHFTNCAYVSMEGCLRDYSLQEYQSASKLNTEQRHVHQLIKRGIDPVHSERIIGFVRDNNLPPGHVFLTVPASVADVNPTERIYLANIRRHIVDGSAIVVIRVSGDADGGASATAGEHPSVLAAAAAAASSSDSPHQDSKHNNNSCGKSSKQLSLEQIRKEMKLRRELAMLRKYHAMTNSNGTGSSASGATAAAGGTSSSPAAGASSNKQKSATTTPQQQYRSVMALNVSRKMTKG